MQIYLPIAELSMNLFFLIGVGGAGGTLGLATKVLRRSVERPATGQTLLAAFTATDEAGAAVSAIIAAGILPAAVEMMDRLSREAAEAAVHPGSSMAHRRLR